MITNSNEIKEFQMFVKIEEISKRRNSNDKPRNLRLIMVNNKPCIQLVNPRKGNIKEIGISNIAGVFLCQNSKGNCFKLIFPDKTMIFSQSDKSSDYEILQWNLNALINQNYNSGALQNIKTRVSVSQLEKLSGMEDNFKKNSRSSSLVTNKEMEVSLNNLLEMELMDTKLFRWSYNIPEINLQVDPLNEADKSSYFPLKSPYSYISKLRKEIGHNGGIKIDLTDKYSDKYKLTMINNELWVSDIINPDDTKKELHFGDRIATVNGEKVENLFHFQQITKHNNFTLIIQRLPKAKVFLMYGGMRIKPNEKGFKIEENDKSWKITEVNEKYLLNSDNKSKMIKNFNQSDEICGVVLHEKTFIKKLREQIKKDRNSIKL